MAAIDELKKVLVQDIQQLERLADVLNREKDELKSAGIPALERLTEEKNEILKTVRERARRKIHLLVEMGFQPKNSNPSQFIRAAGLDELAQLWSDAQARLRDCHNLNSVNGRIIGNLQQRLGRLTELFRGAGDQAKLYGASGQSASLGGRNVLASA